MATGQKPIPAMPCLRKEDGLPVTDGYAVNNRGLVGWESGYNPLILGGSSP